MNSQDTEQYKMMQPQDFHKIIDGIDRALFTFESTSNQALLRLYRRSNFSSDSSTHSSSGDNPLLTESEHEHIFLVYLSVERDHPNPIQILTWPCSFIFTLQEFAGELMSLTDAMRRIYAVELARFSRQNWFKRYFINGPKSFLSCIRSFRRRRRSEKTTRAGLRRICKHMDPCLFRYLELMLILSYVFQRRRAPSQGVVSKGPTSCAEYTPDSRPLQPHLYRTISAIAMGPWRSVEGS